MAINVWQRICTAGEHEHAFFAVEKYAAFFSSIEERMKTAEKAKVVDAVWGTEFNQFHAALDIFHPVDFEEKDE